MESEHGYRKKCIHLIAKILKIKPNTIQRWGKGVDFDKIPDDKRQKYEIYLRYVDALRVIITSLGELNEALLLKMLQELEKDSQIESENLKLYAIHKSIELINAETIEFKLSTNKQ